MLSISTFVSLWVCCRYVLSYHIFNQSFTMRKTKLVDSSLIMCVCVCVCVCVCMHTYVRVCVCVCVCQLDGRMEDWVIKMDTAVKARLGDVSVLVCTWLPLAQRLYPIAVRNTREVGREVALLLDWLEVTDSS